VSDPLALNTADGASRVTIADPTGSPIVALLLEIGASQAVIETDVEFEANAYLDLTLELKGQPPRKFFAHVVGPDPKGLRIRWMHLDPGEEQKLKGLLAAYARTQTPSPTAPGHGTRRVIRAKSETFTPFGGAGEVEVQLPAAPPQPPAGEHRGTRRVIKPAAKSDVEQPAVEHEPTAADMSDESKARPVVIAATDKFEKLRHIEDAQPVDRTPVGNPALSGGTTGESFPDAGEQPSSASTSGRTKTIGKDGRMDVGAAIRSKAKTVRASELAARHDKVRVLNMATIKALIQDAVEEAAAHLTRALGEAERKRLLEEAEEGFKERLKAFEIDKKSAEEKARLLQNELNAATELLNQERKRSIAADQFTVSEAGLAEIDVRMAKVLERAVARGEAGPELELKLREMIVGILDSEREKMREKELAAHNDKIALLEKKVARLAHSLDSTEKERDEARQIAEAMEKHGISAAEVKNKYRIGLDGEDPNRERKLALMRELVEQNRELRKSLGIKTKSPEEAAREVAEQEKRKREEAEQAKREALAEPDEKPAVTPAAAAPEPPADPAPAADEPAADDASADDATTEPAVDPDDLPWEPSATTTPAADSDDRGVKILRDFKHIEPPPLDIAAPGAATETPEDGTEVLVDPDDLPWEESPPAAVMDDAPSAIKRIVVPPSGSGT
jgi:hypothetical protein